MMLKYNPHGLHTRLAMSCSELFGCTHVRTYVDTWNVYRPIDAAASATAEFS
jgi:hypothetical protein